MLFSAFKPMSLLVIGYVHVLGAAVLSSILGTGTWRFSLFAFQPTSLLGIGYVQFVLRVVLYPALGLEKFDHTVRTVSI